MPLSRAQVDKVFLTLLGRRPEGDAVYRWGAGHARLSDFVLAVGGAEEFRARPVPPQAPDEATLAAIEPLVHWDRLIYHAARARFVPVAEELPR